MTRTVEITDRAALEGLFAVVDDDITAVAQEEHAAVERAEIAALIAEELGDLAELDALTEEAAEAFTTAEVFRVSREVSGPAWAHRRAIRLGESVLVEVAAA